jgi:hypothetical protein
MRASGIDLSLALVLFAASVANAAPPAAPQVTLGADLKLLRFDWEPVAGATFYQLRISPTGSSVYRPLGETIPASITQVEVPIAVHLQDWVRTRYIVAACNSAGCTNSAALNPRSLMLDTIGYLKASNTDPGDEFGHTVTLSADGYTLAVGAFLESSNASGVNGDQTNNSSPNSGAVYIFRRRGNSWQQEAYLKAGVNESEQSFGNDWWFGFRAQALSADGSILAVSASRQTVGSVPDAGAVYVFRRVQNAWSLMATLHAPQPSIEDFFGTSVDMSLDGRTLKINSASPYGDLDIPQFRTHIFVRPASTWRHSVTLVPSIPNDECYSTRLSADGQTIVSSCVTRATNSPHIVTTKRVGDAWVHVSVLPTSVAFYQLRQPIALNTDATVMALSEGFDSGLVGIYRWASGAWVRETGINRPGWDLAFNSEGNMLGIGLFTALESGPGISPITMPGTAELGAVYVYQRNVTTNTWALRNVVKSANPGYHDFFGRSISFSASGRTLAVGAPRENSNATGIDGVRNNEDAPNAGAAYLY